MFHICVICVHSIQKVKIVSFDMGEFLRLFIRPGAQNRKQEKEKEEVAAPLAMVVVLLAVFVRTHLKCFLE